VKAGAVAVVARPQARADIEAAGAIALVDENPRRAFARLAAPFFAPLPETVVAVTGTNGKTSTVEMLRQIWRMAGHSAASIGTLGITTADEVTYTGLTTPDVVTFLANMAGLAREGSAMLRLKHRATACRNIAARGRASWRRALPI
jgi:UDP-N-acetylmuramoyl-L-alanyl-D-glutamate--2,6-diaminopimelate ligase